MSFYRNHEGYIDPTAGEALSRISREEKRHTAEKKPVRSVQPRPLVYICSRYSGDVDRNTQAAREYCRFAVKQNAIPVAPHLLYPQFLDDANPAERSLGLYFAKILMDKCDEVWIFSDGEYSAGMRAELERALRKGCKIRFFSTDCRER